MSKIIKSVLLIGCMSQSILCLNAATQEENSINSQVLKNSQHSHFKEEVLPDIELRGINKNYFYKVLEEIPADKQEKVYALFQEFTKEDINDIIYKPVTIKNSLYKKYSLILLGLTRTDPKSYDWLITNYKRLVKTEELSDLTISQLGIISSYQNRQIYIESAEKLINSPQKLFIIYRTNE